jgi:hypothetical protein
MSKANLRIDWATHEAAKYACENWHYSKCLPVGKLVKVGAWEDGKFIGVVLFGRGANNNMLSPFGLSQDEGCELVRIALTKHKSPVSRIAAQAMRFLKTQSNGLRLIVSYADPEQGHHGGIYQAGNWVYVGISGKAIKVFYNGKWSHKKTVDDAGINQSNLLKKNSSRQTPLLDATRRRHAAAYNAACKTISKACEEGDGFLPGSTAAGQH